MVSLLRFQTSGRRAWRLWCACLALLLAGCGGEAPPATPCPESMDPAVVLDLLDESGQALSGATLRYRLDDAPWQTWPERAGSRTVIRGRPGQYEIELARPGYETVRETLSVAAEAGDACRPVAQAVSVEMARLPCPEPSAPLVLTFDPAPASLEIRTTLPDSGRQAPACLAFAGETCRQYSLPAEEIGAYRVELAGLPGLGPMQVKNDVVTYEPSPVELLLDHRGRQQIVALTGAETAALTFPVRLDEANCPLADFRSIETLLEPDLTDEEADPPLAVSYLGSLTMTDLGAAACRGEPSLTSLPFGVDLPAGTPLANVRVLVEYGQGPQAASCEIEAGQFVCRALVPNPLLNRPFAVRVLAGSGVATGMQLPFGGLCLIFE